ncbi:hypothetical protein M422DRAFT_267692 [Sphaerobolus stellatus SS14]|uniref:Uncharacterized protein n=1 Tax=Sphaerobolus stellatus (strain SS14) TaxID=990650 RepID=A0A0C9UZY8_SPHS4|nr:hypothetical protein M422DRAFT_267692 [Sphaerobolus stellatus SS14]
MTIHNQGLTSFGVFHSISHQGVVAVEGMETWNDLPGGSGGYLLSGALVVCKVIFPFVTLRWGIVEYAPPNLNVYDAHSLQIPSPKLPVASRSSPYSILRGLTIVTAQIQSKNSLPPPPRNSRIHIDSDTILRTLRKGVKSVGSTYIRVVSVQLSMLTSLREAKWNLEQGIEGIEGDGEPHAARSC